MIHTIEKGERGKEREKRKRKKEDQSTAQTFLSPVRKERSPVLLTLC